jgi:aryl sulfotransferase
MKRLVWLASYPKSGNTWVRLFLEAYRHPDRALDINSIDISLHAGHRDLFDQVIGLEASDLIPAEIDRYRPDVYRQLAVEAEEPLFIKVHDGWRYNADGAPLFPSEVTAATIYIVRDPRGVAPSFANHYHLSLDAAIERMAKTGYGITARADRLPAQLPQPMGSWSQHVAGWLDQRDLPLHRVRYEDLHAAPLATFAGILAAAGLTVDEQRLAVALAQSRFDRVQGQEATTGFKERLMGAPTFFRRGQLESWRKELTPAQSERIVHDHAEMMQRLGYLPAPQP